MGAVTYLSGYPWAPAGHPRADLPRAFGHGSAFDGLAANGEIVRADRTQASGEAAP